jgi:hypothetical protein
MWNSNHFIFKNTVFKIPRNKISLWLLISSFCRVLNVACNLWVVPRRVVFNSRRFGTLYLFHLHRRVGMKWVKLDSLNRKQGKLQHKNTQKILFKYGKVNAFGNKINKLYIYTKHTLSCSYHNIYQYLQLHTTHSFAVFFTWQLVSSQNFGHHNTMIQ